MWINFPLGDYPFKVRRRKKNSVIKCIDQGLNWLRETDLNIIINFLSINVVNSHLS